MNIPPKNIRRRRLLVFIPVILLFVLFYFIGYKANATRREATNFTNTTGKIAEQSNFLGSQFRAALTANSKSKSKFLGESLDNMIAQALTQSQRAESIEPPEELKLAHSFFVVSMKLRHQGLEKYSRKILTAFDKNKSKTAADDAINDINLSDTAYQYFLQETRRYLSSHNYKINLKKSNFITPTAKKKIEVVASKPKKEKKKEKPANPPDLAIVDVATEPLRISFNPDNDIRVLPDTNSVDVRIEIENKGSEKEEDIAVNVELLNGEKSIDKKDNVLSFVSAGKKRKITIDGFEPLSEGINIFKITVGSPDDEENKEDNSYTYKFIFDSQDRSVNSEDSGSSGN